MVFRSFRFGFAIAAAIATMAVTAPTTYAASDHTFATSDLITYDQVIVAYVDHAFDLAPLAIFDARPAVTQRSYQTYAPMPVKAQRFGAAVNATSKAGWGSGRLRKLAG